MTHTSVLTVLLVLSGAGILSVSLVSTTHILDELPEGSLRNQWRTLRGFIVFFLVGYLGFLGFTKPVEGFGGLLVPLVFFLGAGFVQTVCSLSLGTVRDVKRIATLENENITDPLMEIFNRRHLERRLDEEFHRATRYGFPLAVLMLDLDHFKKVNDDYGHPTGDLVLKGLGAILKESVRQVDVPARYGGEEAVVVLPHTGEAEAVLVAERIRRKAELQSFPVEGSTAAGAVARCTVSIGIAMLTPDCPDASHLVQIADKALYRAKQEGRNRTVAFRCEHPESPAEGAV